MSVSEDSLGKELYKFGPFLVDPKREILLRDGTPVQLTPKTFQILLVLIRQGQELVSKDDLMRTVWPDTFVEEANLSRNIFMLRKALGESPQDHRYVITVPGRGYRLAEAVRVLPNDDVSIVAARTAHVELEVTESRSWKWLAGAACLLVLLAVGAYWLRAHRKPVLTAKDTVVLADFANNTGEPVFDETLRRGMAVQLEQSPFLSLVSDDRILQILKMMGQPAVVRLTPELSKEVCERVGSAAVLDGSIARLGTEYVLGLRARNCRTGSIIHEEQVQAKKKEDVLNALDMMSNRFRERLGEELDSIEKYDRPLAEASTPSLDALKALSTGINVLHAAGSAAAIPFFARAVELDPNFALAHAFLGRMYGDLGEFDRSAASTGKAYELRNRASDRERFFITASFDLQVTGNLEKAQQACDAWMKIYPRDVISHAFLGGIIYPASGKYQQSAQETAEVIEVDPDFALGYILSAFAYQELGRIPDAEDSIRRMTRRKLNVPDVLVEQYDLAFLKGDKAELRRAAEAGKNDPGTEGWITSHEAFVAAYHGRNQQSRILTQRAVKLALQMGERERAAQFTSAEAVREALFGNAVEAKRSAENALKASHDRDVEYGAAFALTLVGDLVRANSLATDLESRFPEDTSVRFSYLPCLRALLALKHNQPAKAIAELQVASSYEFGVPRSAQHAFFGALYPIYLRGEAYLALNDGPAATAEFLNIIDHRGIIVSDPVGALVQLQLGRALVLSGDSVKAKDAYQTFFALWKEADRDIPILQQARNEFGKFGDGDPAAGPRPGNRPLQ